ncbi:hypothetical protein QLX08_004066 [Tetragonisca angustula]|uniref:UHRF1-binding protein 1 n=1 Tax=Tetragonisca angustula TaxID=166442 RepID=A0AAW1A408_9HYME
MVSLIKKQLLKHLSRFTKNLSADKINLSTFKGEGELTNLELDETVLTDLLELPSWLRLTNAWCNKVSFRIQWTKLRSVPIFLSLDEVHIEVETCEDLRDLSSSQGLSSYTGPAKYSFIHKVIDGITVTVNTVSVTFKSPAFIASVQMNRIIVESKSATWQRCDLRTTRVKDPDRGQLLIFKELEWQTVRIEAQSTKDKNLTPLRLLTNQARCRITIKKRISDCFVMGSRLILILDDLLWVLTDSQLKAALHFIDSLGGLIEKATMLERKTKAARKLEVLPEYQAQISQQSRTKNQCNTAISKIFTRYDVVETSYHFLCQRIDLHLCDDAGNGRSSHPDLKDGGALQISLVRFQVDYYPYHLAMADRKHWAKYKENTPHSQWLQQSLSSFRSQFMDLIDSGRTQHSPLTRSQGNVTVNNTKGLGDNLEKSNQSQNVNTAADEKKKSQHPSGNPVKNYILEQLAKLMTTCIIIRIDDFTLYKVTTTSRNPVPKEFVTAQPRKKHASGERDKFCLPEDVTIVHAEFTYYYYPGDITFPLPPPKFYVQLKPIQVNFDVCSCLWFNSFALNLYHSLMNKDKPMYTSTNLMYFDVKIEAIHPRMVFESQQDYPNQKDRPKSLHIQTSRASITNVRSTERSSRADLAQCVNAFQMGQMFFTTDFPNRLNDFHVLTDKFLAHCAGTDNIRHPPPNFSSNSVNELVRQLHRELLWTETKDIWCCNLEPVWGDFLGARAVGQNRPVTFLDAFPLTLWCYISMKSSEKDSSENKSTADIHGLAYISNLVSVQINHYQYLFLLRLSEVLSEMATYLNIDSNKILKIDCGSSLVIGALIPQVEVTFVMPSHTPGKENSGGDLESVMPDSSSIADDIPGSSIPWQSTERVESSGKKININNETITPQSDISSMLSMDFMHSNTPQTVVTFKQNGTNKHENNAQIRNVTYDKQCIGVEEEKALPTLRYAADITHKHSKGDSSSNTPFISNNFNVGFSSMRKGLSNLMTSIDSALKASPEDGSSDTMSIRSDVSSDSENYVLINLQDQEKLDAMFSVDNSIRMTAVEEASEVVEETPDTQSEKSMDSVCKRKDIVSMATFKLSKVEFIQQSLGYASSIKVQISNIGNDECSSIPWDEFQTKFSARSRGWVELPSDSNCRSCIKLRLDHDLKCKSDSWKLSQASQTMSNKHLSRNQNQNQNQDNATEEEIDVSSVDVHNRQSVLDLFEDKLEVKVTNISMSLSMSSISGLTDLTEDEIIPRPIPLQIYLESISLRLNEDRPPNNITSPGPIPIDLNVAKLKIVRDVNGVFHIEPVVNLSRSNSLETLTNSDTQIAQNINHEMELSILRQSSKQLKSDNEQLRRRLNALEKLSEENAKLIRIKEESNVIKSHLSAAQEDIQLLLKEKRALQETVTELQNRIIGNNPGSGTRASWSSKR